MIPRKHRGAHAEHLATAWLLSRGFDVFRNVSQHGLADLIAIDFATGERLLIDVKSSNVGFYRVASGEQVAFETVMDRLTPEQRAAGVRCLAVMRDGSCVWADTVERRPMGGHGRTRP